MKEKATGLPPILINEEGLVPEMRLRARSGIQELALGKVAAAGGEERFELDRRIHPVKIQRQKRRNMINYEGDFKIFRE